jgi:hypothetical protein
VSLDSELHGRWRRSDYGWDGRFQVVGNAIRPRLNECEARVCITFESSSSLIFPPIEQLKVSVFGASLGMGADVGMCVANLVYFW